MSLDYGARYAATLRTGNECCQKPGNSQWHVTCIHRFKNLRMATRMKMMKMLQEMRGFAELTGRRPFSRPPAPLLLQFRIRGRKLAATKPKRVITVIMRDEPDIPHPVPIQFLEGTQPDQTADGNKSA